MAHFGTLFFDKIKVKELDDGRPHLLTYGCADRTKSNAPRCCQHRARLVVRRASAHWRKRLKSRRSSQSSTAPSTHEVKPPTIMFPIPKHWGGWIDCLSQLTTDFSVSLSLCPLLKSCRFPSAVFYWNLFQRVNSFRGSRSA